MPRRASGTEWINCTHPRQLRTADVRRIISVNAQLSRRRSSGKVAPKRLKSVSDGANVPRRRSSNGKRDDLRYGDEIDKLLAGCEDDDKSPISDRGTTPESIPSLSRTNSVNSDDVVVEVGVVRDGQHKLNLKMDHLMFGADPITPLTWASRSRSSSPSTNSPKSLLDSGLLDPFATGSVPTSREMNNLLLHLMFIMVPVKKLCEQQPWHQFCPVISLWARTAVGPITLPQHYLSTIAILSNPMLQYAVCGLAAAHMHFLQGHLKREFDADIDALRNRPMLVDCLFYQGKVMEELHRHLIGRDDFADICNVVSTMCLLAMSVYFGVRDEIVVHINGITNLVKERGGWEVIPLDVAQIYLCTIYLSAIWTSSVPPQPPRSLAISEYSDALLVQESGPALTTLGERLLASTDSLALDDEFVDILCQAVHITRYREYCLGHGYRVTSQEVEIFTLQRLDLEYRLMNRLFGEESTAREDQRIQAIEISLLTFSVVNLELLTLSAGPFRTLVKHLRNCLDNPNLISVWWPALDILMWVLFLGAHISVHPKERLWFTDRIAQLLPRLGLQNWDEARLVLTGCFYVDRMYEDSFKEIWNEAVVLGHGQIFA